MAKDKTPAALSSGRGASSNRSGRFERLRYVDPEERERIETTVTPEHARDVLTQNDSPDVPFSVSINPYRGCEHGCIYCFARPTHAYLGLSPGLDFETKILSKPNAAELVERSLSRPGYRAQPIAIGANTDPYQPVERDLEITRSVLEVLLSFHHPVAIVTKSHTVLRDLDVLAPMAAKGLANVFVSVTSLDPELARHMEPRASSPQRRIDTVRELSAAGVPVGVLASPMIPALNDAELEEILNVSAKAGARAAGYILVRLPLELKDLFTEWLDAHYPDKTAHVLNLIRETRDGALYRSEFGTRMRGTGVYADLLEKRFNVGLQRAGLADRLAPLDVTQFEPPERTGDQLSLFEC